MIHSREETFKSRNIIKIRAVIQSKNAQSLQTNFFCIIIGTAIAETHKIIHKLNIFDQIIFHIDKEPLHWMAAIHDRNNSGADVHIARIVSQINKSDT